MLGQRENVALPFPVRWSASPNEERRLWAGSRERLELCRFTPDQPSTSGGAPAPLFVFPTPFEEKRVHLNISSQEIEQHKLAERQLRFRLEVRASDRRIVSLGLEITFPESAPPKMRIVD